MSSFVHSPSPGATYFLTLRLADPSGDTLVRHMADLRRAMRHTLDRHPFYIDAIAVLPSVIHTIWTVPPHVAGCRTRIGLFKTSFSRALPMPQHRTPAQIARGEKGIWQRRFWHHQIRDQDDFNRHRDLVYLSPVHAGLTARAQDWPHSSLHRDLKSGSPTPDPTRFGVAVPRTSPPRAQVQVSAFQ